MSDSTRLIDPVHPRDTLEFLPTGTIQYGKDRPDDPSWVALDKTQQVMALHSFAAFVDYLWPVLHPGKPFRRGAHVDVVCFALEQAAYGRIEGNELLINIPPRMLKSVLVNVLFPAWVWLWSPWAIIMGVSGSDNVARRDNRKMRAVVLSERYKRLIETAVQVLDEYGKGPGEVWNLVADQNQKERFENTFGGQRYALASGSKVTGEGMHLQLVDDLTDAKEAMEGSSDQIAARLQKDVDNYEGALSTRMNDPGRNPRIVIMQRLHEADLAGSMLARGVPSVVLPMEFDPDHPHRSPLDWRTTAGELLLPSHYPPEVLAKLKADGEGGLGPYGYAAQFQQLPSPAGGGMFPKDAWVYYTESPLARAIFIKRNGGKVYLTFDCAAKTGSRNAYSVALVVGYLKGEMSLLAMYREKVELPGLEAMYDRAHDDWPGMIDEVLIEDASNGTALLQTRSGIPYHPQHHGGKETRAGHSQGLHRQGRLLLPRAPWAEVVVHEHALFPNGAYKDIVDALAQVCLHVRLGSNLVTHAQALERYAWLQAIVDEAQALGGTRNLPHRYRV